MNTLDLLTEEQEDEELITVSIQEKGGIYQAVLSYKDLDGKWRTKWKSTKIKAIKGNKKIAGSIANKIRKIFESELKERLKGPKTPLEEQLNMNFVEFLRMRLEQVSEKKKYNPNTYARYYRNFPRFEIFFNTQKHQYKVKEITPELIDDFYTFLSKKYILKNTSINEYHKQISIAYSLLDLKNVMRKPTVGTEKLKLEKYKSVTFSMNELIRLLDLIKDDVIELPILFAVYYGMRRSEIIGLRWSLINFDEDYFIIDHTCIEITLKQKRINGERLLFQDETKSEYGERKLPLYPEIKDALKRKQERIRSNKLLFGNSYNNKYLEYVCVKDDGDIIKPNHVTHRFPILLKRYDFKHVRFHDLRHTMGTELSANGVDLKAIGEWLGHGDLESTERYSHPDYRKKLLIMSVFSKMIQAAREKEQKQIAEQLEICSA